MRINSIASFIGAFVPRNGGEWLSLVLVATELVPADRCQGRANLRTATQPTQKPIATPSTAPSPP